MKRGGTFASVAGATRWWLQRVRPNTGRQRQQWIAVKGAKRDAERKLAEEIRDLDTGVFVEPSRPTLSEYLEQWLRDHVALSVRPRTAEEYRGTVRHLREGLGKVSLSKLSSRQIQRYYSTMPEKEFSAQTILHHHRVLSQAIAQAVKWDMLSQNVATRVTPPKRTKPELRLLALPEMKRLLEAARGTDYFQPIYLAIHTGLRRSAICGLNWSDGDLEAGFVKVVRTMISLKGDRVHFAELKSRNSWREVAIWRRGCPDPERTAGRAGHKARRRGIASMRQTRG